MFFRRPVGAAQSRGDHIERHDSQDHEDDRLKGIGPSRSSHASEEDVNEHHTANDQRSQPFRNTPITAKYSVNSPAVTPLMTAPAEMTPISR